MPNDETLDTFPYLPDEYMIEIGRVALAWNYLDSLITHTLIFASIGYFATDMRLQSVVVHMNYPQKMDALSSVLNIVSPEMSAVFSAKVKNLLNESSAKRNTTLHQTWMAQEDGVKRFNMKAKGTFQATLTPVTLQELASFSPFIMNAHSVMFSLITTPLVSMFKPQEGQ